VALTWGTTVSGEHKEKGRLAVDVERVKIFGERNTSTNALKRLIEMNSAARVLPSIAGDLKPGFQNSFNTFVRRIRGREYTETRIDRIFESAPPDRFWKHCATTFDDVSAFDGTLVLFLVRNPYSWLQALHRRPYHARQPIPDSLEEFLTTPWNPVRRDRIGDRTVTPIELYNAKLQSYLGLIEKLDRADHRHFELTFESFAIDQLAVFECLRPFLKDPADLPQPLERSTKDRSRDKDFYRDYYGRELWKKDIGDDARALMNEGVDWAVANEFGYEKWV